jgi:hypothetical protein
MSARDASPRYDSAMRNHRSKLTDEELQQMQTETGVNVYALLDLLDRTPSERLQIAMANTRNLDRLRTAGRTDAPAGAPNGAFDALAILAALQRRGVQFVVIGGVAGYVLGSSVLSANLDICFAADSQNVQRLLTSLHDLNARSRTPDRADIDEDFIQSDEVRTFSTDSGFLHCVRVPAGTDAYNDLQRSAERVEIGGALTDVASLPDLIRMKETSDRPKDRLALITLRAVQRLREKV